MLPKVDAPESGIQHLQSDCRANINSTDQGNGTLYISQERLIWENEEHRGLSLGYKNIAIHAISKDLQAFPEECLYVMYNGEVEEPSEAATNHISNGGTTGHESSDEDGGDYASDRVEPISEIRFVPEDKDSLKRMFDAMSDCQCLHPDSEDSDDFYENESGDNGTVGDYEGADYNPMTYEDGGGEGFYTTEEGFQHLTPQGQATLERLENMLAHSQISQDTIAQMSGVQVEDGDGPCPDEPPLVGRAAQKDDPMEDDATTHEVEGQFDDAE